MTGGEEMFEELDRENLPCKYVIYADNSRGKVLGNGKVAISNDRSLSNVMLVEEIGYSLLSVSQLCDAGLKCLFLPKEVIVSSLSDDSLVFKGYRAGKLYLVNFQNNEATLQHCLIVKTNMG
jgi:hypothetical protein